MFLHILYLVTAFTVLSSSVIGWDSIRQQINFLSLEAGTIDKLKDQSLTSIQLRWLDKMGWNISKTAALVGLFHICRGQSLFKCVPKKEWLLP